MQKGNWRYDIVEAGYKMNMTDLLAAIGLVELARYDRETLPKRKAICEAYRRELGVYSWAELPLQADPDCESSYHLFPLRIRGIDEATRDRIIQRIAQEDVSVNVHFIPVPMMSFYRGWDTISGIIRIPFGTMNGKSRFPSSMILRMNNARLWSRLSQEPLRPNSTWQYYLKPDITRL